MTAEQKAELRRLAEANTLGYIDAACSAIPELLDELEAAERELVRVAPFLAIHGFEGYAVGVDVQEGQEGQEGQVVSHG